MERMERNEKDDVQKTKLIFLALAALVVVLLIVSFGYASKARNELNAKNVEIEALKQDNIKLELMLKDQSAELDTLKKHIRYLEDKAKAKPAAKKKGAAAKTKTKTKSKTR
jgi:regulatory protein YycI of two-component signal transduction system YycFG